MQDNNNSNLPPGDYRAQYQNYNYVPDNMELRVGFGRRLGAMLIDAMILAIILLVVFSVSGFLKEYAEFSEKLMSLMDSGNEAYMGAYLAKFTDEHFISFLFIPLMLLLYNSLEVLIAATPGKLLLDMRIAGAGRKKADTVSLVKRFAFKNSGQILSLLSYVALAGLFDTLSSLAGLVILIGCFFVLGAKRQAFHDMLAKTAVYRKYDVLEESN